MITSAGHKMAQLGSLMMRGQISAPQVESFGGAQINPQNLETPFLHGKNARKFGEPNGLIRPASASSRRSARAFSYRTRWGLAEIYQDVCGPCQLQLHNWGILMNRVSKHLQQEPLNSIEQH